MTSKIKTQSTTVGAMAHKEPVAVLAVKDGKAWRLASKGEDGAALVYGTLHSTDAEGTFIKWGNETRLMGLTADMPVVYASQKALLTAGPEAIDAEVSNVSKCGHTHDRAKTGLDADWFLRTMKPGATSFSGICKPCAAKDSACLAGTRDEGKRVFNRTTRFLDSCAGKRARKVAAAADRKALKEDAKTGDAKARVAKATPATVAKKAPAKKAAA